MPANKLPPAPTFEKAYAHAKTYQLATPFGIVTVADSGRQVTFELWRDVRQSVHDKALFSYYQSLRRRGIERVNLDHLKLTHLDHRLPLKRGKARLDLVYVHRGETHEIELKTHREVGLDVTARQLEELAKHCHNLTVVVPRRDTENMRQILTILKLERTIQVDSYELLEDEGQPDEAGT